MVLDSAAPLKWFLPEIDWKAYRRGWRRPVAAASLDSHRGV